MSLHQSGEDYLEAIFVLREQHGVVHSIDVAQHLGYSKPSVSRAVSVLKTEGYLTMEKDGRLELTQTGIDVARNIHERHQFLKGWLVRLGVSPETAEEDACKIEHNISDETFQCLKRHGEREG
ncbi:MAG: metal-dependent transcriptional regulator [Oscillospiraceae bacterium]|nr:metal-dependent transcriptional regulator [Oscillospiraceae bacterium]